jgi:hypothetical protein
MLVVFDDKEEFRKVYAQQFSNLGIQMPVKECETKAEVRKLLADKGFMKDVKLLIFDLSTSKVEAETLNFEILDDINSSYQHYSIPIFIHSAFADKIDERYDNLGTLFKIKKSDKSIEEILNKILTFYESGFLDMFSPGGYIELELFKEIHKAFNGQFQGNEIEATILSIKHSNATQFKERVKLVFERIAIRTLYQNLLSAKTHPESNKIEEILINAIEHYYRRKSDFKVWTGDIFEDDQKKQFVILTPRCDINNDVCKGRYISCSIEPLNPEILKKMGSSDIQKYLTDNPQQSGIKYRFLIPAPNYVGGKVDLTDYFFALKSDFDVSKYKYIISLSDELTNDIVRKFSSYILRGGISASEISEASFYSMNAK